MKYFCLLCLLPLFFVMGMPALAQSSREVDTSRKPQGARYNTAQKIKKNKKLKGNKYDRLVEEHEERMKDNAKEAKKTAKEMEKPQYSDPSYFGHKRPPKKHPLGRKKFCKECGIVH